MVLFCMKFSILLNAKKNICAFHYQKKQNHSKFISRSESKIKHKSMLDTHRIKNSRRHVFSVYKEK